MRKRAITPSFISGKSRICIAQSQGKNNNFVVECDDDGSSSDEEVSSNASLNEELTNNGTANGGGGEDESVATSIAETRDSTSAMQSTQEQIEDGQADSETSAKQSARGNRTAMHDEAFHDGITALTEEDQDKEDDEEDYVFDGRSVISELSMSTTQAGSFRTDKGDAHMPESEMATHENEVLEQQQIEEVVYKAKCPLNICYLLVF